MLQMTGTNHRIAPVRIRSLFSMDKDQQREMLDELTALEGVTGAVILSTCNRIELWISTDREEEIPLQDVFFQYRGVDAAAYGNYFSSRSGEEAVLHLFYMTSGLRSAILAEDQILAQVKDALEFSRLNGYTDSCIETLFRMAVTTAKEVKTKVHFTHVNRTAIEQAVQMLERHDFALEGKKCLVIGNGQYGKLAATTLRRKGAQVSVTVRRYDRGSNEVTVPEGCEKINYLDRIDVLRKCDLVVSATSSPHFTITLEDVQDNIPEETLVMIDLAVPRDIDPRIGRLKGYECYNIDDFGSSENELNTEAYEQAKQIIETGIGEFRDWINLRRAVPQIQKIKASAVEDLNLRIHKIIRHLSLPEEEQKKLLGQIDSAAGKVVNKMLFDLYPLVSVDTFLDAVNGLERVYRDE